MSLRSKLEQLIRDAKDYDPDKRFMAANDLCTELLKSQDEIDANLEKQICAIFLTQLDDTSIEVQGNAVRCIKRTVGKIQESQVSDVIEKLGVCLVQGKVEFRDIYSTCLKGLISDVPDSYSRTVTSTMLPMLMNCIKLNDPQVKEEATDILTELLRRFSAQLYGSNDRSDLINAVSALLNSDRPSIRKKATQCIGAAAVILPQSQLQNLVGWLMQSITRAHDRKDVYTFIQAISAISRTVGYKLNNFLKDLLPLLFQFCSTRGLSIDSPEIDMQHELIEICLASIESFIRKCPREIVDHIENIFGLVFDLISYDPNYSYNEDQMEEDEDWGSDFEDEEFSDAAGDDSSWKVRRAAVHVLEAIIKSRPEVLSPYYSRLVEKLVDRFKEREENVKLDIFKAFSSLIKSILVGDVEAAHSDDLALPTLVRTRSSAVVLNDEVPMIIQGVLKELSSKNSRTRQGVTTFLMDMSLSLPAKLNENLGLILNEITKNLEDINNSNLRMDTLIMLKRLFRSGASENLQDIFGVLLPHIQKAISDEYFKIAAEGLRVAGSMVKALPGVAQVVRSLYPLVLNRLTMTDIDQEVKQASIYSAAIILSVSASSIDTRDVRRTLELINDRLKNEVTRMNCLKAWTKISLGQADLPIHDTPEITSGLEEMRTLLKKSSRALKLSTLETILAIVKKYHIKSDTVEELATELPVFINDSDLHLAQNALEILSVLLEKYHRISRHTMDAILANMNTLSKSSLVQGGALAKLCQAYSSLVKDAGIGQRELCASLQANMQDVHRHGYESTAQCIASVCLAQQTDYLNGFLEECVKKLGGNNSQKQLSALCIGEIGKHIDLSGKRQIDQALIALFDTPDEDTKICASVALGKLAVGNLTNYLPHIFAQFHVEAHRYLLLIALKEVISHHFDRMVPYLDTILPLLFDHSDSSEESVRSLVAECLGKLFSVSPDRICPQIEHRITTGNNLSRATIVNSIKFAATSKISAVSALEGIIQALMTCFSNPDVNLRRSCMLSLNAVAYNVPQAIKHNVNAILDQVYPETVVKQELIKKVDLGPFTHIVDDGLPLRKAAYGLLETLLDTVPEKVEPNTLVEHLIVGLDDPSEEVQMLCHQVLSKLSTWGGGAVLGALDAIVLPLRKNVEKQLKLINNKQEVERATDVLRSCFRCVDTITHHLEADSNMNFREFITYISSVGDLSSIMQAIKSQRETLYFA
ncbi:unnamed protein product [Blepharisma stoltei]|uniref:TATA-binding protein interacting (TIP20) domain-containing protein n=1 Tax=Blepharisma stoltei TaxID=1481888 RepID=A0AAU9K478_9CILI|nr:unnamed protein product [Blepharisma stoltei]